MTAQVVGSIADQLSNLISTALGQYLCVMRRSVPENACDCIMRTFGKMIARTRRFLDEPLFPLDSREILTKRHPRI